MHRGILQRTEDLDTAVEVARHHVGRGDIHSRFGARQALSHPEAVDSAVLEEAADDWFDANVLGEAGNAGAQATDAAYDEFNRNAGLRSLVKRIDDVGIDQRIHFQP